MQPSGHVCHVPVALLGVGLSWAPLISGLVGKPTSTRAEASLSVFRVIHTYQTSAFSASCSASFVGSTAAPSQVAFTAGR